MKKTVILALVVFSLLLMSGCGEPPECEQHSDCAPIGVCSEAFCSEGMCEQMPKDNCCGNLVCEEAAGENPCSCNDDCKADTPSGLCEGKLTYPHPHISSRTVETDYAQYYCTDKDRCVVGVPSSEVQEKQFLSEHGSSTSVEFELVSTISQPFVVDQGTYAFRLKLVDVASKIRLPVRLTSVQVLSGSELIAEKTLSTLLTGVGDFYEDNTLLLNPKMSAVEDELDVSIKINYEYTEIVRDEAKVVRTSLESMYRRLYFIEPGKV